MFRSVFPLGLFVLVLVLSVSGTRTLTPRSSNRGGYRIEYEYEYHFIEYEYERKPKCATSKCVWTALMATAPGIIVGWGGSLECVRVALRCGRRLAGPADARRYCLLHRWLLIEDRLFPVSGRLPAKQIVPHYGLLG